MMDIFKKKKDVELPIPSGPAPGPAAFRQEPLQTLPSELEQFRMQPPVPRPAEPYPSLAPTESTFRPTPAAPTDKIDLIISKLETIDARLRVLEEKLERKSQPSTGTYSPIF